MKKFFLIILITFSSIVTSFAQEGMWQLSQLDRLDLEEKGMKIDIEDIYNPNGPSLTDAIIQLGGGSASFVSPEGLILTNHHVAYTALQRASSTESDYLTNGFLAQNKSEEISAPGYIANILIEMKDVTSEVLSTVKGIDDPVQRDEQINAKINEITEAIEEGKEDINSRVASMYNGKQYVLFVYKQYNDIRIVYAPPSSIGKYGGDIDNWMWPRHTGDFSFLRAYMATDGTGREYHDDNIPVKPKTWLKVADEDLKDGDLTFVIGFPGFTTRYRTHNSADWNLNKNYPNTIHNFEEIIDIMDELTENSPEGKLKVADLRAGLANTLKNFQGKIEAMSKTNYVQKKIDFEYDLQNWINSDEMNKKKYGHILHDIEKQYEVILKTKEKDDAINLFGFLGGTLASLATQIYDISKELDKHEDERRPGINDQFLERLISNLQFQYSGYYKPVDKAMLKWALKKANALPEGSRIDGLEHILKSKSQSVDDFVDEAYSKSKLSDIEFVKLLFGKSLNELEGLDDPLIKLASSIYDESRAVRETYNDFAIKIIDLRKQYLNAVYEWKGEAIYPDANGTIRFTAGNVKGYHPRDAVWYYPFTTLKGVIEKHNGEDPFNVPDGLQELGESKDYGKWADPLLEDVPVAFTHQVDITGGNSGSPVLNAKGEIVGVVFDGNYEALISDWQYDYDLQRCISVDIRYVLFITEKLAKANYILKEMGVN